MNSDEIVSNIITLIHSTTRTSYVTCSQLTSHIFNYLSEIPSRDHLWNEFNAAIDRFDQSFDHPDLCRFRQLIETISRCANDDEERNYTLGRDRTLLIDSIHQLEDLLQSHVNLHCFLLSKLIEREEIRLLLIDLMNLTSMNVGTDLHRSLCSIVHLLIEIDRTFATSNVIDHPIVSNCIRLIQMHSHSKSPVIAALRLLTDLLLTNQSFPVHSLAQLSNCVFIKCIFDLIEIQLEDEELVVAAIKYLLAFNLRFDYPHENPIIITLLAIDEQISSRQLIERLILLFNRSVDPIENSTTNSVIKFLADLFGEQGTLNDRILFESDRRLIIEILSRELSNRSCADQSTMAYLSLLELILRDRSITPEKCPRIEELQTCFRSYLYDEQCSEENRYIVHEILQKHAWLSTNDMPFSV